jgi:hypothetical protein
LTGFPNLHATWSSSAEPCGENPFPLEFQRITTHFQEEQSQIAHRQHRSG